MIVVLLLLLPASRPVHAGHPLQTNPQVSRSQMGGIKQGARWRDAPHVPSKVFHSTVQATGERIRAKDPVPPPQLDLASLPLGCSHRRGRKRGFSSLWLSRIRPLRRGLTSSPAAAQETSLTPLSKPQGQSFIRNGKGRGKRRGGGHQGRGRTGPDGPAGRQRCVKEPPPAHPERGTHASGRALALPSEARNWRGGQASGWVDGQRSRRVKHPKLL